MKKLLSICVALALVAGTVACGKSDGAKVDEPAKGAEAKKEGAKEGDAKKEEAKKEEAKKEEKAPAGGDMSAEAFADAAPAALCGWLTGCKNEEITVGVQTMMVMTVAFGAMARPDMKDEIESTMKGLKKEGEKKNAKLDGEQCGAVSGLGAKMLGLDKATLGEAVKSKRVAFDAAKAKACLDGFKNVKACETEKKVEGDPKLSEMEKMMEPYKDDLEGLTKACESVLVGQVAADGACTNDYECKEGLTCKGDSPTATEKKCVAKPGK